MIHPPFRLITICKTRRRTGSAALLIVFLFAAGSSVVEAQSASFGPAEVVLRDAGHSAPRSGVRIGPGNAITIQAGIGTPTAINALSFGKGGTLLAAGKDFGRVVIWNVVKKKLLCALDTGQGIVHAVALSPDGEILATAGEGDDFKLRLWHVPDGKLIKTLDGFAGYIQSLAFGPRGGWIVIGVNGGPTRVLDLGTEEVLLELPGGFFPILSTDGSVLMTTSKVQFTVWNTSDWSKLGSLPRRPADAIPLAVNRQADRFVFTSAGAMALARLSTGESLAAKQFSPLPRFNLSAGGFAAMDAGAPGLVFGHSDGRLWVWDTRSGKTCSSALLYSESGVLSRDGRWLAGAKDNAIFAQGRPQDGVLMWDTQRLVHDCGLGTPTETLGGKRNRVHNRIPGTD